MFCVFNIVPKNIEFHKNITNLTFFYTKQQCYSVQENALVFNFLFGSKYHWQLPSAWQVCGSRNIYYSRVTHAKVSERLAYVKHLSVRGEPVTLQHVIKYFLAASSHKYLLITQNKNTFEFDIQVTVQCDKFLQ